MTQELSLSSDLNVITAEINSYKQVAGQAIFEIGRRLKHVKENDLVHGQWESWLNSVEIHQRQAQRFIKVFNELETNATPVSHLGIKMLYEIATMPDEEREKEHVIPSTGETKKVNEMTSRELREVKKALREAEEKAQKAQNESSHYQKLWNQVKNKPAQIVTQTKEVVSEQVKREIEHLKLENAALRNGLSNTKEKLKEKELQSADFDEEMSKRQLMKLQKEADISVLGVSVAYKRFIENTSITPYLQGAIATATDSEKKRLTELIKSAEKIIHDSKMALSGRKVSVVNE